LIESFPDSLLDEIDEMHAWQTVSGHASERNLGSSKDLRRGLAGERWAVRANRGRFQPRRNPPVFDTFG
jgi:hypothetical protein